MAYPLLQLVPLGRGLLEPVVVEGYRHLSQEVVTAEHVAVPHRNPQGPCLQLTLSDGKLQAGNGPGLGCSKGEDMT